MRRTFCIALVLIALFCAPVTFAGGFAELEIAGTVFGLPGQVADWLSAFTIGVWDKIGGHADPFGDEEPPKQGTNSSAPAATEPEATEPLIVPATFD